LAAVDAWLDSSKTRIESQVNARLDSSKTRVDSQINAWLGSSKDAGRQPGKRAAWQPSLSSMRRELLIGSAAGCEARLRLAGG